MANEKFSKCSNTWIWLQVWCFHFSWQKGTFPASVRPDDYINISVNSHFNQHKRLEKGRGGCRSRVLIRSAAEFTPSSEQRERGSLFKWSYLSHLQSLKNISSWLEPGRRQTHRVHVSSGLRWVCAIYIWALFLTFFISFLSICTGLKTRDEKWSCCLMLYRWIICVSKMD